MPFIFQLPIVAALLALAAPYFSRKLAVGLYRACILGLILLAGLRWKTGTDWNSYQTHFDLDPFAGGGGWFELGYELLVYGFRRLSDNYTLFLLGFGSATIGIKAWIFARLDNPFAALFFYCCLCFADLFFVRQSLAISLVGLAVYLFLRRPLVSIVLGVAATLVHVSAALPAALLVVLYAFRPRTAWWTRVGCLCLTAAVAFFAIDAGRVSEKRDTYFSNPEAAEGNPVRALGRLVLACCYGVAYLHLRGSFPPRLRWFASASFPIAVGANLLAEPLGHLSVMFTRFFQFSAVFEVVAGGLLWSGAQRRKDPVALGLLLAVAGPVVLRMVGNFQVYGDLLHPFEFFWEDSFKQTY
jgi:hypothetical protein